MGLYDYINCEYPLPREVKDRSFQTKDTECQYMETYTIKENGELYFDGKKENFTGEIHFYSHDASFISLFVKGDLIHLEED